MIAVATSEKSASCAALRDKSTNMKKIEALIKHLISRINQTHLNAFCAIAVTLFVLLQLRSLFNKKDSRRQKSVHTIDGKKFLRVEMVDKKVGDNDDIPGEYECLESPGEVGDNDDIPGEYECLESPGEVLYRAISISDDEAMLKSQLFYEKMKRRRSVRSFSTRPVSAKLILNLIKTAGTAPSGANMQPWTFCVVGKAEIKSRIRAIVEAEEQVNYSRRVGARWVLDVAHLSVNWCKPYLTEAPFLIVIMKQTYQLDANGERHPTYYNEISVSIAAGLLVAAIHNAGLVTVTTTPLNSGHLIRELLNRPKNEKVLLLLPIGYPAEGAMVPDIKRKVVEEIVRFY
ncbi:Uncharacterized protein C02C2.5 [Toxocara canis]|uniref:Uncharacterized protein C02C2.5 n=1 Tax=Toxocara canis TaxID=6265 RepID=A0A0B2V1X9_TOXCA|nr:Uncharacterized protein C02C2.5 [Toxocara canis]